MNSDHSPRAIAQRVKQARQEAGLSQESLGKKLGLSKVGYGEYERVSRLFDTEQLFQLARILGRSVGWFLGLPSELSGDEQQALSMYGRAKEQGRDKLVLDTLKILTREDNA